MIKAKETEESLGTAPSLRSELNKFRFYLWMPLAEERLKTARTRSFQLLPHAKEGA